MAFSPLPNSLEEALKEIKMWREKYTQQRTWVGLTELDMAEFVKTMERGNFLVAIYDIEKKLKDKNND